MSKPATTGPGPCGRQARRWRRCCGCPWRATEGAVAGARWLIPRGGWCEEGVHARRCEPNVEPGGPVDADLDTLASALYVTIDDTLAHALNCAAGGRPWGSRP